MKLKIVYLIQLAISSHCYLAEKYSIDNKLIRTDIISNKNNLGQIYRGSDPSLDIC